MPKKIYLIKPIGHTVKTEVLPEDFVPVLQKKYPDKCYYLRMWEKDGLTWVDFGSHTDLVAIDESGEMKIESIKALL